MPFDSCEYVVLFQPILPGGRGVLSAFGRFNQWGEGAVRIQSVGGAHVCKLLLQGGGGGPGGRHSVPKGHP